MNRLIVSKAILLGWVVVAVAGAGLAQSASRATHSPAKKAVAKAKSFSSDLGFTYGYQPDWTLVDTSASLPAVQQQAADQAKSDEGKQSASCAQVALTLRHSSPASVIVAMALPFACYGSSLAPEDISGFGTSVAAGVTSAFDVQDPQTSTYHSGTHDLWIQRAKATLKSAPEQTYTIEAVCGLLKKAAVCWVGMVKDDADLKVFEEAKVSLEGDALVALVPKSAFGETKK